MLAVNKLSQILLTASILTATLDSLDKHSRERFAGASSRAKRWHHDPADLTQPKPVGVVAQAEAAAAPLSVPPVGTPTRSDAGGNRLSTEGDGALEAFVRIALMVATLVAGAALALVLIQSAITQAQQQKAREEAAQ